MNVRLMSLVSVTLFAALFSVATADHKLEKASKAPEGVSKEIAALLDPAGYRVVGADGPLCEIWLVKELAVQPGFKPTLNVKYPFTSGQLIGAIRVAEKAEFTDFRGQEMAAGVYTLRYAVQPEDGDHVGTSDVYDFLLAISAKVDEDPAIIKDLDQLNDKSAAAVNTTHPAVFSLLAPSKEPPKQASLTHDEDKDFWILHLVGNGTEKKKKVRVPLRLVAIGQSEE